MVQIFKIGHFGIYLFGITIALGMLVGLFLVIKEAKRKNISINKILDLAIYTIVISVLGARIYYVIAFNLEYYLNNPIKVLFIRDGGLSIQGALIFGITFAFWYAKKIDLSFWKVADTFAPGIIIGQAIGRIGCDVFGIPMIKEYPWGILVNSQLLHPSQLYESILDFALFCYLWKSRKNVKYNGQLFIKYIVGFSFIRAIVEFFRINPIIIHPFSIAHVTSFIIITVAILIDKLVLRGSINKAEQELSKDPLWHYIGVVLLAVAGIWLYYFIH